MAEISKGVTTVKGSPKVVMDSKKRQQKLRERRERKRERRPIGPRKLRQKVQPALLRG